MVEKRDAKVCMDLETIAHCTVRLNDSNRRISILLITDITQRLNVRYLAPNLTWQISALGRVLSVPAKTWMAPLGLKLPHKHPETCMLIGFAGLLGQQRSETPLRR